MAPSLLIRPLGWWKDLKKYTKIGVVKKDNSRHIKLYKILGENIRFLRNNKGLTQDELAYKIKSAANYIGCIERGEKFPSLAVVFDIANALNCKVQDLFEKV